MTDVHALIEYSVKLTTPQLTMGREMEWRGGGGRAVWYKVIATEALL